MTVAATGCEMLDESSRKRSSRTGSGAGRRREPRRELRSLAGVEDPRQVGLPRRFGAVRKVG